MSTLAVDLLPGLRLANPIVAAAGTVGRGADFERLVDAARLGAVVVGPVTRRRRVVGGERALVESAAGLVWSGRAPGAGLEATLRVDLPRWRRWRVQAIASLAGAEIAELVEIAEALADAGGLAALEIDTSCADAAGRRFDETPARAAELTAALREAVDLPLIVKLWQGGDDPRRAAEAVLAAGADALSLVNAPAAIVIDTRTRRPIGGVAPRLCGPAIRPMAVRMVYELARALPGVPLIGAGGVTCADDALQFIMAGARAVQVGTATLVDPGATIDIIEELEGYVRREGLGGVSGLIGAAL